MNEPNLLNPGPPQRVTIQIAIIQHECSLFRFTDYGNENKTPIATTGYEFQLVLKLEILESEKIIKLTNTTKLFEKQSENLKLELAELMATFKFSIPNFEELIKKTSDKNFQIINPLMHLCYNVAVSGVRGMYTIKLENTIYKNAILPFVDINKILPKKPNISS